MIKHKIYLIYKNRKLIENLLGCLLFECVSDCSENLFFGKKKFGTESTPAFSAGTPIF